MSNTESASLARAERTIETLKAENASLRKELEETKSLYNQLVHEAPKERFDERRVLLLKSQLIQIERQNLLLTEALSSRSTILLEIENALSNVADKCRSLLANERKSPQVPISRSDLIKLIESLESSRIKLYRNIDNNTTENLAIPLKFNNKFVKPNQEDSQVTMLDVCSGKLDHLSLKQVSKLESKLASLYKQVSGLQTGLGFILKPKPNVEHQKVVIEKLYGQVSKVCDNLADVCQDLSYLMVLVPSSPWPPLQKSKIYDIKMENVMKALPKFPRSKQGDGKQIIESLIKANNFGSYVATLEAKALKEELAFHQTFYDLEYEFVSEMLNAIRTCYTQFEKSAYELICEPLKEVLEAYDELKSTASDKSLKLFLCLFKENSEQIQYAIDSLTPIEHNGVTDGSEALSNYAEQFFVSLENVKIECRKNRDTTISELDDIKKLSAAHSAYLKDWLENSASDSAT